MDGQAARVAEVGDVVEQLQRIDEAAARGGAAGQLEADQAAEAALQIGVGAAPALAVLQRREDHLDDVAVPFEELGHGHGIAAMLANAQRQRLQPLQEQEGVEGAERVAEVRSEEHTSELQSLMRISYAVFCLKKKKNNTNRMTEE